MHTESYYRGIMAADPPDLPDVVAFALAHLRGDQEACIALLEQTDGVVLLGHVVSVALEVAYRALPGGRDELERMLVSWQARRNAGL